MSKPEEPKKTGSRSYDQFKQKQYQDALKKWEKEQKKKGIQNDAAVKAAEAKAAEYKKKADELTSISSFNLSEAAEFRISRNTDEFSKNDQKDHINKIQANATNLYNERRNMEMPGRLSDYKVSMKTPTGQGSRKSSSVLLRERLEELGGPGSMRAIMSDDYKITGGAIDRYPKILRVRKDINREANSLHIYHNRAAQRPSDFEEVNLDDDPFGTFAIERAEKEYEAMPQSSKESTAAALRYINMVPDTDAWRDTSNGNTTAGGGNRGGGGLKERLSAITLTSTAGETKRASYANKLSIGS